MEVLFQLQFVVDCLKCLSQSEADVLSLCLGMVAREERREGGKRVGGKREGGREGGKREGRVRERERKE